MMARIGVTPLTSTPRSLCHPTWRSSPAGEAPVWGAYVNAVGGRVQRAGYKINIIYPDDYGVHFYGDTLFASETLSRSNPDLVRRFLRASLKGWTLRWKTPLPLGR